jgi:hypothetical protein
LLLFHVLRVLVVPLLLHMHVLLHVLLQVL